MKKWAVRIVTLSLSALILSSSLIGCGKEKDNADQSSTATSAPSSTVVAETTVKEPVTLTYWAPLNNLVAANAKDYGETEYFKELQKRTGVTLDFITVNEAQAKDQFNLLLASGSLPDIIEYDWYSNAPGGVDSCIENGQILKLNEVIDKYAVNLKGFLKSRPDIDKMVKTDSGNYYVFPFLKGDDSLLSVFGPMLRKDWLDSLNMSVPTTIDEWYTVLKAFKDQKGATAPLAFEGWMFYFDAFVGAYGISRDYYVDGGKVKFGPMQPEYKDFLSEMQKWYSEGLFDKNLATVNKTTIDANIYDGKTGSTLSFAGSGLGNYIKTGREKDPKFEFVAAPFPTLKAGEAPKFGYVDMPYSLNYSAAISATCKNVEAAAKLLDYGYGEEGLLLNNFGIEGVSYKMVDKYPTYTDMILNNPDKLSVPQAMAKYIRAGYGGPTVQDKRYIEQYYTLPQQKAALNIWKTEKAKYMLPRMTFTADETSKVSAVKTQIGTYVDEMFWKFVLGAEPISNFDKYVEQIKKLNVETVISANQGAYDRYDKR